MNIFQCQKGVLPGGLECAFRIVKTNSAGKPSYFGCVRHGGNPGKDFYNLYPEHDYNTGDAVYQPSNPGDPFKLGEITLSWENLTSHQSGRNYDSFRDFPADIHPLYSVSEHNHPTKSILGVDDVGDVFGDDSPALVHSGWKTEKFYGKSSVELCQGGIYGRFDTKANMIMHTCMRSHIGVPGFINYTNRNDVVKKELYIGYASDNDIISFAAGIFKDTKVALRMADAMLEVKRGNYINLWTVMTNNFVAHDVKRRFMSKISSDMHANIYKGRANLMHFCSLYSCVDQMNWTEYITDANGDTKRISKSTHSDLRKVYKENILNWILNYPPLQNIDLNHGGKYAPHNRYWFVVLLIKRAKRDGILNKKAMLPEWMISMILEKNDPMVKLFGKPMLYSQLPAEYKGEYHEAQDAHLDTENPTHIIENLYPGMINIKSELLQDKKVDAFMWGQFLQILKAGRRWSISEIKNAWEHFEPSWIQDDPSIFYSWLENVADLPMEEVDTISKEEGEELVKRGERKLLTEPGPVTLAEHGACNFNLGDGGLSQQRAFASNLLNNSLDYSNWETWDDYDVVRTPVGNWYEANAKVSHARECNHETFWAMLAQCGGLIDDRRNIDKILSDSTLHETLDADAYEEALIASQENVASINGAIQGSLDGDDLDELMGYDPITDETSHLSSSMEGIWLGEE